MYENPGIQRSNGDRKAGPLHCVIDPFRPPASRDRATDSRSRLRMLGMTAIEPLTSRGNCACIAQHRWRNNAWRGGGRLRQVLLIVGLSAAPAAAQSFPAKPIKMVVPYTPGSPVDVLARLATQHAGTRLGQTIVIDNRPGAGTTHRHQGRGIGRPRRLYDPDRRHELRHLVGALSQPRLRPRQELCAGGDAGAQPAGAW